MAVFYSKSILRKEVKIVASNDDRPSGWRKRKLYVTHNNAYNCMAY